MKESYKTLLVQGEAKLGIWGIGYLGYSNMATFASNGVRCIGYDIKTKRVDRINAGEVPIDQMAHWLGFEVKPMMANELIYATKDWTELISPEVIAHLICIPTEREGRPYLAILEDTIHKLCTYREVATARPPLVIIESTLTPNTVEQVVLPIIAEAGLEPGKSLLLGVAPRRDWFTHAGMTLRSLDRVVGGTDPESTRQTVSVLSIVSKKIHTAPDHQHAEIVKSVENAYRHMNITLANQLTLAYPGVNMTEVLRLVGTKWNIEMYHPSFGAGGYCIPVSSQYVLDGASRPECLTLMSQTVEADARMAEIVADSVIRRGSQRVGILGLSYKGGLKVHILSPTLRLVELFKEVGIPVKVEDPFYSTEEIRTILGVETFTMPEGLSEFDTLLIVADHRQYACIPHGRLLENLQSCRLVLDNVGIWGEVDFSSLPLKYYRVGSEWWLGEPGDQ
ncbi:nucleotide sugar dehydrogenase [Nitrospinae bacterium AH_259_B05_G02_I21]|nr:nucleotide sugar dehydrogenase [Nitrospinae bacterium AH_259_B05_G02_I21]MDA2931653.1 nucleotide sugar dehydrogenase [Nitrospinae bacterium AH-259-F20]